MKWINLIGVGMLAFNMPASAADSVYLNCQLAGASGGSAVHLQVALNEAAGTASYTVQETGKIFSENAVFTPSSVVIGSPEMKKVIDRTTLAIEDGADAFGQFHVFRRGTCQLAPSEARKF